MNEYNVQNIANIAWAFATVRQLDEKMFVALASASKLRMSEHNEQNVASTAWALATMWRLDVKIFVALEGHRSCR